MVGPSGVSFADAAAEDTTAPFSAPGTYVLTLNADDGELTGDASLTVIVEAEAAPPPPPDPAPVTETFEGSLNKKWPSRTFETTVAAGDGDAVLTFGKRSKKAASTQLRLNVYDAQGALVANSFGGSALELSVTMPAGVYSWEVTGARMSFALEVSYLSP